MSSVDVPKTVLMISSSYMRYTGACLCYLFPMTGSLALMALQYSHDSYSEYRGSCYFDQPVSQYHCNLRFTFGTGKQFISTPLVLMCEGHAALFYFMLSLDMTATTSSVEVVNRWFMNSISIITGANNDNFGTTRWTSPYGHEWLWVLSKSS